ncbi:MAG: beta-ketoacyl-[acyl-carrier-protein] synthase family protein [Candidatus Binatia bacterium]
MKREAVITGMGLVSPLGSSVEENWQNLKAGRTGISYEPHNAPPAAFQYAGKVESFEAPAVSSALSSQIKFLNRSSSLGFAAAAQAVAQSGLPLDVVPPGRRALYIGSGDFTKIGHEFLHPAIKEGTGAPNGEPDFEKLNAATLSQVNPFFLLESISNNLFSFLSAAFEFRGANTSLASLSPYGAQALELAGRSIQHDRADVALAVGCGSWITAIPLYELEGLGLLSKCKLGARSFRPFDRSRDGFIPGEGGAALFLEAEESVKQRGGGVLGRIAGAGNCIEFSSALNVPDMVAVRSLRMALEAADGAGDLAFICSHGSATQKGDRSELMSLLAVMEEAKTDVPICGLKPYTGHMGAASDLAEIIFGVKALAEGLAPATLNFTEPDRDFSQMKISAQHQPRRGGSFLSLSYGMGGQSSSIIVSIS